MPHWTEKYSFDTGTQKSDNTSVSKRNTIQDSIDANNYKFQNRQTYIKQDNSPWNSDRKEAMRSYSKTDEVRDKIGNELKNLSGFSADNLKDLVNHPGQAIKDALENAIIGELSFGAGKYITKRFKPRINKEVNPTNVFQDEFTKKMENYVKPDYSKLEYPNKWLNPKDGALSSETGELITNNSLVDLKHINFPEYEKKMIIAQKAADDAHNWVNSQEWLNRRMKASGETIEEAQKAQKIMRRNVRAASTNVRIMDNNGGMGTTQGLYTKNDMYGNYSPQVMLNNNPENQFYNTAHHEALHGANTATEGYMMKGLNPIELEDFQHINPKFHKYMSSLPEQQVRGVRALKFLEENNRWKPGQEITDEHIDFLKNNTYMNSKYKVPGDVGSLITNYKDKNQLRDFLNKVYIPTGAAIGVSHWSNQYKEQ